MRLFAINCIYQFTKQNKRTIFKTYPAMTPDSLGAETMRSNKPNRLEVKQNLYGHNVVTNRALESDSSPKCDIGYRSLFIKAIAPAHAEHLLKKFISQYKAQGCEVDEICELARGGGGACIEMSSPTRDVVILYRPEDRKLSVHVHYMEPY